MLGDRIPTLTALRAIALGVVSCVVAVAVAVGFAALASCARPPSPPVCTVPPRPAIHCPDLLILVYRDCAWRCE